MHAFFKKALTELEQGHRVFACFVADNKKGSPGTPAARMLYSETGEQYGTVGGGIMEKRILEHAADLFAGGASLSPQCEQLAHHSAKEAAMSGLFCGGAQTNVSSIWEPTAEVHRLLSDILAHCERGGVLEITAGGMSLLTDVGMDASSQFEGTTEDWRYRLNLVCQRRIAIFGGGHCGRALAEQMLRLEYAVALIDPRENLYTLEGLSEGIDLLTCEFDEAVKQLPITDKSHAVVMTHSFPTDVDALVAIMKRQFLSVGVMGSAPKITRIRTALKESGLSKLQIAKIRAPVGLSFDSDTPEEIAVSIAAQILLERSKVYT